MVGFEPKKFGDKEDYPKSRHYVFCGAVSGVVTRAIVQPLDVIKIRFQLQVEPITQVNSGFTSPKYQGLRHAVGRICLEESVTALWKGHNPAQLLSVGYGAIQFVAFEASTKFSWTFLPDQFHGKWKPVAHFICGGFAGCTATVVCQPLDVLRTRFVAQGEPKMYKSSLDAIKKMYAGEGVASFYKGLVPTLVQIFPQTGLQFSFYTSFKSLWPKILSYKSEWSGVISEGLVCGALAGICSKTVVYPFDMVKKRLQVQGFEKARYEFGQIHQYSGVMNCVGTIIKEEGTLAFFKGLYPSLLKAAVSTALIFVTYECCCTQMKKGLPHLNHQ